MYVATLDISTGGIHASVYEESGRRCGDAYKPITYDSDRDRRHLEFDPRRLLDISLTILSGVIAGAEIPSGTETIIAVTGQRHGSVFLDRNRHPVLAVANLDGRVDDAAVRDFEAHQGEIYDRSGRAPYKIFPAFRLYWMAQHMPELYSRIDSFLMINEWFAYQLSGEPCSETTNIAESMLFDIAAGAWSDQLIDLFGQQHIHRWPVVEPGAIVGTLRTELAEQYSLPRNAMISLAAGDTQCAVIGTRATEPGDVVVVNGSTTPVVMVTGELTFDPQRRAWADLFVGGRYLIESNAGKTGTIYREIQRILSCQDVPEPLPEVVLDAERYGVGAHLTPNPTESTLFLDSSCEIHFNGDIVRALQLLPYMIIENTAFSIAAHVRSVVRVLGSEARRVFITGGSSRSMLTQVMVATLLQEYPLFLTRTYDTTSDGAAILALARLRGESPLSETMFPGDAGGGSVLLGNGGTTTEVADLIRGRYEAWIENFPDLDRRN